jgi:hypothetical protein
MKKKQFKLHIKKSVPESIEIIKKQMNREAKESQQISGVKPQSQKTTRQTFIKSMADALRHSLPTEARPGAHECLFILGRASLALLKSDEWKGDKFAQQTLFELWYRHALPLIGQEHAKPQLFKYFLQMCEDAELPLGLDLPVVAWDLSLNMDADPDLDQVLYENKMRGPFDKELAYWLKQMGLITPDKLGVFYLSSNTVMKIMQLPHRKMATRLLWEQVDAGIVEIVKRGGGTRAHRYKYTGKKRTAFSVKKFLDVL